MKMNLNMEVTPRQIRYLAIILVVGLLMVFLFSRFALPYLRQARQLEEELEALALDQSLLLSRLDKEAGLREEIKALEKDIYQSQEGYYTQLFQEDIILQIKKMANQAQLTLGNLSFAEEDQGLEETLAAQEGLDALGYPSPDPDQGQDSVPAKVQAFLEALKGQDDGEKDTGPDAQSALPLKHLYVSLEMQGSYQRQAAFLRELDNLEYEIILSKLNQFTDPQGGVYGFVDLHFFALPDPLGQNNRIEEVSPLNLSPRPNPFQ